MRTIPQRYGKNGYTLNLVDRVDDVAIYEQSRGGKVFAFEVVKVRVRKAGLQFGREVPDMEFLPGNEEWGRYGKTYSVSLCTVVDARRAAEAQMRVWVAEMHLAATTV